MDVSRHAEVAGHGPERGAPYSRFGDTRGHEELHRLLREATRLIESADLRGASERLRKAGELASGVGPRSRGGVRVGDEPPDSGVYQVRSW